MDALGDHRIQTLRSLVDASGLFDKAWYVRQYGDVIEAGIEPFEDFILFGMFLQRDPGPGFSTEAYIRLVPESLDHPDGPLAYYLMSRGSSYPLTLQTTVEQGLQGAVPERRKWLERLSGSIDVGLQSCEIKDFRFTARGWVIDKDRPGAVNRLRIRMGNVTSAPVVARQIIVEQDSDDGPQFSGLFTATSIVPDHLIGTDLVIEVIDTDTAYKVRPDINPAPVNESARTPAVLPDDRIIGRVDRATPLQVAGWALVDATKSAEGIELVLKINGEPLAVTRCNIYRPGIQKMRGGDGYFGFQFNLPENLWTGVRLEYEVISSQGDCRLINRRGTIIPEGGLWFPSPKPVHHQPFELKLDLEAEASISVIILNRNGRDILEEMLESAEATGDLVRAEWIVVDHQSSDGSVEMCERFAAAGFDVKVVRRNGNPSFSESNNFGVSLARGRTLIFANNDLLFSAPVMDRVIAGLRDRRVGILGAELVDYIAAPEWDEADGGYAVQHHGVHFKSRTYNGYLRPFEARASEEQLVQEGFHYLRPAVTAAFIAMRREVFELIGGFDEAYSYGLEDVDLSLKVTRELSLSSVLDAGIRIIHRHGFSRKKDTHAYDRNLRNNHVLNSSWGVWLRSQIRQSIPLRSQFWTGRRPIVGFTVSTRDMENSGDYFTALELGKALQRTMDVHLVYLSGEESIDLADLDILINVSPRFNLHDVQSLNPYCIRINWVRQHFDTWLERESIYSYDHTICSSRHSADLFQHHMASAVDVMPIASDTAQFAQGEARPELKSDYCFTGSYFGVKREIEFNLDPSSIMGQGAIFGKDWEATSLAPIARGPLSYAAMPDVYASTRIVIDDGIFATAPWGSVNSRVFDALAAGCLVVTNNVLGAKELFGDLLPTYRDRDSLTEVLNWWLTHEDERKERVRQLQQIVQEGHDYNNRSLQLIDILSSKVPLRIALKCPARRANKELWGDYHFCKSLAKALRENGAIVRIDLLEDWNTALSTADDVVIVIRGLSIYEPKPNQINLLWLISHPEDVPVSELSNYDHVCVASIRYRDTIADNVDIPVSKMLQCTDDDLFFFDPGLVGSRLDRALFVGNSRGVFRPIVRWVVEKELIVDVYGGGWESFIKDKRLKGTSVPNEVLGGLYGSSRVVLCDHWKDMSKHGFLSNRAFDVLASGGFLVTDHVDGISDILPETSYAVYSDAASLADLVQMERPVDLQGRRKVAEWVKANHSFRVRAKELLRIILAHPKMHGQRMGL